MSSLNELSESQSKIILDRVNQTEKFMNILLESISKNNDKEAKCRDR